MAPQRRLEKRPNGARVGRLNRTSTALETMPEVAPQSTTPEWRQRPPLQRAPIATSAPEAPPRNGIGGHACSAHRPRLKHAA
uniref:Uncharacterized protein n=1 Tax=Vitis vinifera TaxID=29760 RepID=A5C736_VITVI|nr:hypothetical protein VITISV_021418 [Vitis vinifera]